MFARVEAPHFSYEVLTLLMTQISVLRYLLDISGLLIIAISSPKRKYLCYW